jgi:Tfp pilus assembly protein PilN
MAIQVSAKKKEVKMPKGIDILFNFSVVFLVFVGMVYFFTVYLNVRAENIKEDLEQKIESKRAEIPEKQELEKIATTYFQLIEDFKLVTKNRKTVSTFFKPFEKMIHPEVVISDMSLNLLQDEVLIFGKGEDIIAVGQQFRALKENKDVLAVNLSELNISEEENEDNVRFSFSIKVDKDLLKLQIND